MILCVGTTPTVQRTMIFPRVQADEVNRARQVLQSASGKSINVARVARTLGQAVVAVGFLGGWQGRFVREQLDRDVIAHDFVEVAAPTRTCTTVIDESAGTATELVEEHAAMEAAGWDKLRGVVERWVPQASVVVLSGTIAAGYSDAFYAECVALANRAGVRAVVDAKGGPLTKALAERPFAVKPNLAELEGTLGVKIGGDAELRAGLDELRRRGATWGLVTRGKAGAVFTDGAAHHRITVPAVSAVNPIGSGDSVAAGLAVGIARGLDGVAAARLACAAGVANALTLLPGQVDPGDVERLLREVRVDPL